MAFSRYLKRQKKKNDNVLYSEYFDTRDVEYVNHYVSPVMKTNSNYSLSELEIETYIWKSGDKVYKVAEKVYGHASLWWVICKFNNKPTESHIKEGDTILIPHQLEKTLGYMGVS